MSRIDSHQHFWNYDPPQYQWIKPDSILARSFGPDDLRPLLEQHKIDGCIAVQARQILEESWWLLQLAEQHEFIRGVVGWVDLRHPRVDEELEKLAAHSKFVGVRHVVQDEPDDRFLMGEAFRRGISKLQNFHLTYDILIYPKQLPAAIDLVQEYPQQPFVLDHIAKPQIRDQVFEPWRSQIQRLARFPNVYCKLSGMVTEARWSEWKEIEFQPYLETVLDCFGEDRLMYGSDWPVALLSGAYSDVFDLAHRGVGQLSETAKIKILGKNALTFYGL